jgi:CDP-glucose 4,6-dehydratase
MGTVNLLDAARRTDSVRVIVNVTTDKCYENREWIWGYREHEALGGYDPYSSSKACSELVTRSWRRSFFHPDNYDDHGVALASARAGNVLGGGDWSDDRLVPDAVRAFIAGEDVEIRSPHATRPWQHVLDPLSGYLVLAQACHEDVRFADAWNFGPASEEVVSVGEVMEQFTNAWGKDACWVDQSENQPGPHEAGLLMLDCSKARMRLGWEPKLSLDECLRATAAWYKAHAEAASSEDLWQLTSKQITNFGIAE